MKQSDIKDKPFRIEEATVDELHQAIQSRRATYVEVVRQYIERVRAFNGVSSMLVTEDGAAAPQAAGAVRATESIVFPTEAVKCQSCFRISKNKGAANVGARRSRTIAASAGLRCTLWFASIGTFRVVTAEIEPADRVVVVQLMSKLAVETILPLAVTSPQVAMLIAYEPLAKLSAVGRA